MAKKFTVIGEHVNNTVYQSPPNADGKFRTYIATRPKKCPLCNTLNQVTKENASWKCKVCGYEWGQATR